MLTIYSADHQLHHGQCELIDGQLLPCFEKPERADIILARLETRQLGPILPAQEYGLAPIARVHDQGLLDFLRSAWSRWAALDQPGDLLPYTWPTRVLGQQKPASVHGQFGYYSFDAGVPITAGTWQAVYSSAQVALTAQQHIMAGEKAAFALCRPPGHHAAADQIGGYCYLNNAAIAAQAFLDQGYRKVAILDVDYHHGNGTQGIFYDRQDVLFVSIHGDPAAEYPFFLGYADETGVGAGEGYNLNLPLPAGSGWQQWGAALERGCQRISDYQPDVLIVSLGVDTYEDDPISCFRLTNADYLTMGQRIAALQLPTLFVMEGGYAVEAIGINTVNVLEGFEGR
ncbi:histone deacetylase family protein [Aeromonas cavernicola]|uniref:Acetylpolyamine amidohydrolase n=1 Tax=Aeromonas cavernicola TaxID=1006623 RepID=A0A2H9U189_9GAMM|nr:histone deacetylase family protein [Aeromonas cavernicola]PJG57784.1 acetylpolyamine amidohydrolase [Aeromonas cavernicola]